MLVPNLKPKNVLTLDHVECDKFVTHFKHILPPKIEKITLNKNTQS